MLTICICIPDNKFRVMRGDEVAAGPFGTVVQARAGATHARRGGERISPHMGRYVLPTRDAEAGHPPTAAHDFDALLQGTVREIAAFIADSDLSLSELADLTTLEKSGRNRSGVRKAIAAAQKAIL